jgi:hypothetical protein
MVCFRYISVNTLHKGDDDDDDDDDNVNICSNFRREKYDQKEAWKMLK